MNIRIQNLGAIKEACIDLNKKLTVFCGPNNTGKTYVSYIIYALTNGRISEPQFMPDEQLKMFINDGKFNLNIDLDELCLFREKQLSLIKSNLDNIFGISEEKIKSYFGQFDISYLTTKEEFKDKIIAEGFTLQLIINELIIKVTKKPNEQIALIENLSEKKNINTDNVKFLSFQLLSTIYNCLAFYPNSTSVIFPVERNSIYTFNKELSIQRNNLVDQMQDLSSNKKLNPWELWFKRTTRYPLAVRDGLEVADDLVNLQNHKSSYFEFADELEKAYDIPKAVHDIIVNTVKKHERILFHGNNYAKEWADEADRRALFNLRSTPEAACILTNEKNVLLYERHKVFSYTELASRQQIMFQNYSRTLNIEALTVIDMIKKNIYPSINAYVESIINGINAKKSISIDATEDVSLSKKLSLLNSKIYHATDKLEKLIVDAKAIKDAKTQAFFYRDEILSLMTEIRSYADEAEKNTASKYWPYPTYGELLFSVN